jgi:hypothetical protein
MGILSTLGSIASFVPLPGMGAVGKALQVAGSAGDVLGKQQEGAAKGQAAQAQIQQGQDRNAIDLYGQQQSAQDKAAQLDLQRKTYDTSSRSAAGKQALLAMLLGDYKPGQVSVPGVTNATLSGGMGETIKNNPQILELLKSIASKGVTDQATPNTYTGGDLVKAPTLTPLPQQSKTSSILDTIARIAQIGGSIAPSLGSKSKLPTSGGDWGGYG